MCRPNYRDLVFEHLVIFEKDRTIFAAARENGSGHTRLFLINELSGNIYSRNGRADSWEELIGGDRDCVLTHLSDVTSKCVPIYRIKGAYNN